MARVLLTLNLRTHAQPVGWMFAAQAQHAKFSVDDTHRLFVQHKTVTLSNVYGEHAFKSLCCDLHCYLTTCV